MTSSRPVGKAIAIAPSVLRSRPDKIAEVVARDLVHDLVARGCQPGDSLDREQVMLERYDISRESLREALRLLEVQGLITIRRGPGGGAFVGTVDPSNLGRMSSLYYHLAGATYRELFAAYASAEGTLARLAAKNRVSAARRSAMTPFLTDPNDEDLDSFVARHASFHAEVAALADNRVLAISLSSVGLLVASHYLALADLPRESLFVEHDHEDIAAAIIAGRATRAERLMVDHVQRVSTVLEADGLGADELVTWV